MSSSGMSRLEAMASHCFAIKPGDLPSPAVLRITDFDRTHYTFSLGSGRRLLRDDIKVWSDQMTPELDRENNTSWWHTLNATAVEHAPSGAYVLLAPVSVAGVNAEVRPVAAGIVTADQHGSGSHYGVNGPWLGAGHVFRPYRGNRFHHTLVRGRLEALLLAGVTEANMTAAVDNQRSLCTALKNGFRIFAIGPDRDPGGCGDPLVYLHWQAGWCPWANEFDADARQQVSAQVRRRLLSATLDDL